MPPRMHTLPQATTESAREARKSFFCELCQKGYARMNEFEAHEGSYDHQHRKRMKEMKQLTKDSHAAAKARTGESKHSDESGVKTINISLASSTSASGKKKPVFKSTFQPQNAAALGQTDLRPSISLEENQDPSGAISNGWDDNCYRPQFVTACSDTTCDFCRAKNGVIDLAQIERDTVMTD